MLVSPTARCVVAGLWLAVAVVCWPDAIGAATAQRARAALPAASGHPRVVNGLPSQDFPTTGALLYGGHRSINDDNAALRCSGTLIGCRTFLTAAHCVFDDADASHYQVFLQHGGLYPVASVSYHPGYNGKSGHDVAVVRLGASVDGIDPTPINATHDLDAIGVGLDGVVAGFGQTYGSGNDYGIKRYGAIQTSECDLRATRGEGNDKLVCWDFALPVGLPGADSNTCDGDSGGPLLIDFGGGDEVAGVTSAGSAFDCLAQDHSWDSSVYYNSDYLTAQLAGDSIANCGALPAVGDATVSVVANSGNLSAGNRSDAFTVSIAGTPALVRFALNGEDDGSFNPNLYVKQGAGGASVSDHDCEAAGTGVFGVCEFANPWPGPWSLYVSRARGSGHYQVTATVFGTDPPECGNGTRESGEACDGADLGSCALGPCAGDCTCPAPLCGNGVAESGEACDGADDAICPGHCGGNCGCLQTCHAGELRGVSIAANARRFVYRAAVDDFSGNYAAIDPRNGLRVGFSDQSATLSLAIPGGDAGWAKSVPAHRRYKWKGDGSIDGLRTVRLWRKGPAFGQHWALLVKGRRVPGSFGIDLGRLLYLTLTVDGICYSATW
ncbi:MAG: trypsin-like serine protease [Deltaproteobacteria bacterium]|nr:trypsin-like serine protease [Deltaproteobacteria bacterium]